MKLSSLPPEQLREFLSSRGLYIRIGGFVFRIRSSLPAITDGLALLYADYPIAPQDGFADFHVEVRQPHNPRRWLRPQVLFLFDGRPWFKPLPLRHALAMLEWGLNWCIYGHVNQYLIIHGAVVEKGGHAAILPGGPGVGKSTLCAGLVARGWRLLSDELALISTEDGRILPHPRPVSLKNESIDLIGRFYPDAVFGPRIAATEKGTIAHMKPPAESVARADESARPGWLIFPRYKSGADTRILPKAKGPALLEAARGTFNYHVLGLAGFEALANLMDTCRCFELTYCDLDNAAHHFARLEPPASARRTASA